MSSNLPAAPDNKTTPASDAPPDWLHQFLQNQAQELAIRKEQADLQKLQAQQSFEFSKTALTMQGDDRKHARESARVTQKDRYYLIFGILLLLAVFLCFAMYMDKDQIALEVIKYATAIGISGYGGYAIGKSHGKKDDGDNPSFPRRPGLGNPSRQSSEK